MYIPLAKVKFVVLMYFIEQTVNTEQKCTSSKIGWFPIPDCVCFCVWGDVHQLTLAGGQAEATALSTLVWFKSRTFYFYLEIVLDNMDNNGNLMYNITFVSISCLNM